MRDLPLRHYKPDDPHNKIPTSPHTRMNWQQQLAAQLVKYRTALLIVGMLAGALMVVPSTWVVMDRSIEKMFAPDDPVLPLFHRVKRVFGGNEVILAVYDDPDLFADDESGMERLLAVRTCLEALPGVKGVLSIDMPIGRRVVSQQTSVPANVRRLFQGYTHGADQRTACVGCMLYPESATSVSHDETIASIRHIMANLPHGLQPGSIAGEPVMISDAFRYVSEDGDRLLWTTTVLLALVILVCFRSIRWVVIPILVVQLALLLTNGTMGLMGVEISLVSSIFTAVITVIGIATVVHVIVRFRDARNDNKTPREALQAAAGILIAPIFWACLTDAIGFSSLLASSVKPVQDFGLMLAGGSLMVLVSAALIVPGLTLIGRRDADPHAVWGEGWLDDHLRRMSEYVQGHARLVGLLTMVIAAVTIYGLRWTKTESDFTRNFRQSTSIVKSYELVESKLGGAGVCDVVIPAPAKLDWDFIVRVLRFEHRLRSEVKVPAVDEQTPPEPGLTKVISVADAIMAGSPMNLARARNRRLRNVYISAGLKTMRARIPTFYDALYVQDPDDPDKHWFRVMLRSRERQTADVKKAIISQVEQITRQEFPTAELGGYFVMLTKLIDSVLSDQWRTFGVALLGILMTMVVAFGSLRLALMAIFPNAVPILMVNGMMGWLGLPVNMGAAMIAAVSIGLSIDGSIHYLMSFQRARRSGLSVHDALNEVQQTVGRAMVLSTVALVVGFCAMANSQFVPTIYFGVLVSLAMLGGLLGNLIWLPLLLKLFAPQRTQDTVDTLATSAEAAA